MAAEAKTDTPDIRFVSAGYARGKAIPWWAKMGIKITLAALPVPYHVWKRLGLFQHGELDSSFPGLLKSFKEHFEFYQGAKGKAPDTVLELGPGDSIGHMLCASAMGCKASILVDAGDFASKDPAHYQKLYAFLKEQSFEFKKELQVFDFQSVLYFTNGQYKTAGLASMPEIADDSVDFSYSHAVFEHIPRDEFGPYMKELFRVTKPGGLARHWVDLHDHLGGALNSMRFSERFWESKWVHQAGFYTNRLSMAEMIALAEEAGFNVIIKRIIKWEQLEPPRAKMHAHFQAKSEEELNICTFLMVMEKPHG